MVSWPARKLEIAMLPAMRNGDKCFVNTNRSDYKYLTFFWGY